MSKDLTVIEQKEIEFQENEVTAVMVQDADGRENVYVPLRPLVEGMGLNWSGQYQRIKKNTVLNKVCRSVGVTQTEPNRTRTIKMLTIPISHLNGFLFGINADRVKSEIRPLIIEYQEKCYEVLFQAFNGIESMTRFYTAVGLDPSWIDARVAKHFSGTQLSDIWLIQGVPIEHHEKLQDLLSKGTFDLTTAEHRQLKSLPDTADLQDNMTRIELALSLFADEANRAIIERDSTTGTEANEAAAIEAGKAAGKARRVYEEAAGKPVVSPSNNLDKKKRPLLGDENG